MRHETTQLAVRRIVRKVRKYNLHIFVCVFARRELLYLLLTILKQSQPIYYYMSKLMKPDEIAIGNTCLLFYENET